MRQLFIFISLILSTYSSYAHEHFVSYSSDEHFYVLDSKNEYLQKSLEEGRSSPQQRLYISGKTGYQMRNTEAFSLNKSSKNNDELFELSLALGVQTKTMLGNVRMEIEGNHSSHGKRDLIFKNNTSNPIRISNIKINTLFLNAYYDIFPNLPISPYIGGGIGISQTRAHIQSSSFLHQQDNEKKKHKLAWNLSTGIITRISDDLELDVGYRYTDPGHFSLKDEAQQKNISIENKNQTVFLGLRYLF